MGLHKHMGILSLSANLSLFEQLEFCLGRILFGYLSLNKPFCTSFYMKKPTPIL